MELYALSFYAAAVLLAGIAWIWLLITAFRTHWGWGVGLLLFPPLALGFIPTQWKRSRPPMGLFLLAVVVACVPLVLVEYDRRFASFGPRERMVDDELHITLTGWKMQNYALLEQRPDAIVLDMANEDVTDETLEHLRNLKELKELTLSDTRITDAGLAILATLPRLEKLRLAQTAITDEGFKQHLAGKESLQMLDMTGTKVLSKTLREWKAAQPGRKFVK